MRIAIVGSRNYPNRSQVIEFVRSLSPDVTVVTGRARGVDSWAHEEAIMLNLATDSFFPLWKEHGRSAGMIRNCKMINTVDRVVAFWDGKSPGTAHAIWYATTKGLDVEVYEPDGLGTNHPS